MMTTIKAEANFHHFTPAATTTIFATKWERHAESALEENCELFAESTAGQISYFDSP